MTEQIISIYNAYIIIGLIVMLLHVLSMMSRKQTTRNILRLAVVTFAAWPALPFLYWKFRKILKQQELPLPARDSAPAMLKAVRAHFDNMPFVVIAYDIEKENLHVYSNGSRKNRAELLKHAIEANEESESNGND